MNARAISQDVNGKLREEDWKRKRETRGKVVATGLIEIDALEIFGFLSGSHSPLREREKEGGGEKVEERENYSRK